MRTHYEKPEVACHDSAVGLSPYKKQIMHKMNTPIRIKTNYWLWFCVGLGLVAWSWLHPKDIKGNVFSDWGYLISYLQTTHYRVNDGILSFALDRLFWSLTLGLVVGWVIQCLIMVLREALRRKKT